MYGQQQVSRDSENKNNTTLSVALPRSLCNLKQSSMMIDLSPVSELTFNFEHSKIVSAPTTPTRKNLSPAPKDHEGNEDKIL